MPVNDIINAFNILARNLDVDLQPILVHMEDNYFDHMRRGHFRAARFPMATWNVHDRVLDSLPRTNNSVEGWHHAFAASCGGHHLNFWRFINAVFIHQGNCPDILSLGGYCPWGILSMGGYCPWGDIVHGGTLSKGNIPIIVTIYYFSIGAYSFNAEFSESDIIIYAIINKENKSIKFCHVLM